MGKAFDGIPIYQNGKNDEHFEDCFERMAVDPVYGVEPQLRERFSSVVNTIDGFGSKKSDPRKSVNSRKAIARTTTRKLFIERSDV